MVAWLAGVGRRAQLHSALAVLDAFLRRWRWRPSLQLRIVRTPSPSEQLGQSRRHLRRAVAHRCTCKPWRFGPYACAWMKDGCGGGGDFPVVDDWPPAP